MLCCTSAQIPPRAFKWLSACRWPCPSSCST
jgi:hypothetical protein